MRENCEGHMKNKVLTYQYRTTTLLKIQGTYFQGFGGGRCRYKVEVKVGVWGEENHFLNFYGI